ncbi:PfkB family carbohydrate kinase [Stenotrophomonas maltophilia]|uniref:PfkB family carbohydrate kinase n=1 Tax=Stenotrophomonas maltophilia TaxID=40324 RepID=UPI002B0BDC87|nr:PfkB family carbohydrate kinase [Stenotrophomonas maltophilia]HEP1209348.1 nucleoside 2-deoxyribosyltransferase [Stenotrophomonas maltophilia]
MLTIVGGIYREVCLRPQWDEVYGSAGRAASAVARLGGQVELHGFLEADLQSILECRAAEEGFGLTIAPLPRSAVFNYSHGLSVPWIQQPERQLPLSVTADHVLRFGMLEGTAIVDAEYAVFDPQNVTGTEAFGANGSKARHLGLVLNLTEARSVLGRFDLTPEQMVVGLASQHEADVVVLKMGPKGALVHHEGGTECVPAYATSRVWKIGSGDQFAANFAYAWMEERRSPFEAADRASRSAAFYAQHRRFPTAEELDAFAPAPLRLSDTYMQGQVPTVYLAGPFFTLGQLWVVEQARNCLRDMGLDVFSPYHDVGPGSAEMVVGKDIEGIHQSDVMLAIADGLDSGTIFEVGYARSRGIPVVMYAENVSSEDLKMMEGTDCFLRDDFVSAIYQTAWNGVCV